MNRSCGRLAKLGIPIVTLLSLLLVGCGGGVAPVRSFTTSSGPSSSSGSKGTGTNPPTPQSHSLSIQTSPSNGGTVVSAPSGINCGSVCAGSFVGGTAIALTVNPSQGFAFTGWGGACSGNGGCTVTLNSDQAVVANFAPPPPPQFTLSLTSSGAGTGTVTSTPAGINCGAACSALFNSGTVVTLTPTAAPGSVFAGWSGAACTGTAACTVTITSDTAVGATFVPLFTLGVSLAGTGSGTITSAPAGINCGTTCSTTFAAGTSVSLGASPASGSAFTGWGGACSGTGSCSVTLNSSQSVVANFGPAVSQFGLTVSRTGTGNGSVASAPAGISCGATCNANFNSGTVVTLTPTAQAGSVFNGWGGACSGTGACSVTMSSAQAVTADFIPTSFPVTVTGSGAGTGTVTGSGGVNCSLTAGVASGACTSSALTTSTLVALTAAPQAGSVFAGWSGACSGTGACNFVMGSSPASVGATFSLAPQIAVSVTTTGSGTVASIPAGISCPGTCSATFAQGTTVTMNQLAGGSSIFSGWGGACSGTGACGFTVGTSPISVSAAFTSQFTLTASSTGNGSVTSVPAGINCPGTCSATYNSGTSVTLTPPCRAG